MKISAAQIKSAPGNVLNNIDQHKKLIHMAISHNATLIVFPELSLTNYEPTLAQELSTDPNDKRFEDFQTISNTYNIVIGVGMPIKGPAKPFIGMIIFQPHELRQIYCKQNLHEDEFPYFACGQDEVFISVGGLKIAPAICYESLLSEHSDKAVKSGAEIYFASVAKGSQGLLTARKHMPEVAVRHSMPVLMANCVGPCDNFTGVGETSIWSDHGIRLGHLDDRSEGILVFDTITNQTVVKYAG